MSDRYYPESHERFLADVTDPGHQLAVLHDDGLYRHLRFKRPGTGMYWFDLITWPGVLTLSSDMGHYVFSRTRDMFEFFTASDYINPGYWQEKCTAQDVHSPIKRFSEERLKTQVMEHYQQRRDDFTDATQPALWRAIAEELLENDEIVDGQSAMSALNRFRFARPNYDQNMVVVEFHDTWDWDLTDFSPQFLWCCHAIRWGIEQYRKATVPA